jgi:5-methyltetrahydropteroyltriglutamate--homocysteine methyltransferase
MSVKIRTTHVGSLPGPPGFDAAADLSSAQLHDAVAWVVGQQRAIGLDIINEGELTKGGDWLAFMDARLGGFEPRPRPATSIVGQGRDREEFADFYRWASERQSLFYTADGRMQTTRRYLVCTGPITYTGAASLEREIATLRELTRTPAECFLTSTAPASLEPYRGNEFYRDERDFLWALAEALRVEYETIARAGFLLQVDDAWLVALWDRIGIRMGLAEFRKRCGERVAALNHALAKVPEEQIRYHLCWGSWHGPHAYDIPLNDVVDIMLRVKARYYSFEAANVRHQHEHTVWQETRLPAGKIILPGVVTHSTDLIEHAQLVCERILRFASLVGPQNVIASTDCGFGGRTHPQIAWAKLKALCEGAALASEALRARA